MLQEARNSVFPDTVTVRNIIHKASPVEEHRIIVRPLSLIDLFAVRLVIGTIKDFELISDEANFLGPVVDFGGSFGVCLISSVASKSGPQRKRTSIGNRVLIRVAIAIFLIY